MRNQAGPLAHRRHRLLGHLATVQAALELLDRRTPISAEQRDLVEPALQATLQLAHEIREALAVASHQA